MKDFDFSAERVTRSVRESLDRMGLGYLDVVHCHDIEFGDLNQIVTETIPALVRLKEQGLVRHLGISGLPLKVFSWVLDRLPPGTLDVILSYCHLSMNDKCADHPPWIPLGNRPSGVEETLCPGSSAGLSWTLFPTCKRRALGSSMHLRWPWAC